MKPAILIFADTGTSVAESTAGYLLRDAQSRHSLAWKPSASCQFERDALVDLFDGLAVMCRRGEPVYIELDKALNCYRILAVDEKRQLLSLEKLGE